MASNKSPASRKRPPSNPSSPLDEANLVVMGRIVGPFGVQGWLKVKPFTAAPGSLGDFPHWHVRNGDGWREMALEDFEVHSKGPVAKLGGCNDREGAERLRGSDVAIARESLGEAEEGTLYWVDLVGLDVVNGEGEALGKVEGFFETGSTSVMVVKGERERLIPFIAQYVTEVDRAGSRIKVDWKADYDA